MARNARATPDTGDSGISRIREELSRYLSTYAGHLAGKAGDKLTGFTGQLSDIADNGGQITGIGSRLLQGESPVKAFVAEKAKGVKDSVVDRTKDVIGGGKGSRKAGDTKVTNIIEVIDVGVPLRTVYDHWTQFDKFSGFTKGVQDVSKSEDTTSEWKAKVAFSTRSWEATVQEQVPDERIVWTSKGARATTRGAVSFHELGPALTRIVLVVEYYPSGFFEKTGNLWRAQGRRLRLDLKHFQRFVSLTEEEPEEAWRGEIREGEVVRTHEEAMEQEEEGEEAEGNGEYDDEDEDGEPEYEDEEEPAEDDDEDEADEDEADEADEADDEEER
jgi:uncharacterized membrane protein